MLSEQHPDLKIAQALFDKGDPDEAMNIVRGHLAEDPNSVPALLMAYWIHDKARRWGEAFQFAARAVDIAPKAAVTWLNFGKAAMQIYRPEAEEALKTALSLAEHDVGRLGALINLAAMYCDAGQYERCEETAMKALEIDPENRKSLGNLGIAQLAMRKWKEGWVNYGTIIGTGVRLNVQYGDESIWDGAPDKRVVIRGEQGIGDELSFASMVPDAVKICRKVILDCDKRLVGLFRRSFPETTVYGTRWDYDCPAGAEWEEYDRRPNASIIAGHLGSIFRNSDEDFPGMPYLIPDPERLTMWREFFKTKRKPIIGIAWSGGLSWTAARFRKWKLEELQPIFNAVDAHWVCLQYKQDCVKEITNFEGAVIHDYPWATRTKDYDDTAGLVAACDLVIGMQTSVMHLAAAMGVETWCFVNRMKQWRYGTDEMLWYKAMKLFRQADDGKWPIEQAARILGLRYSALPRLRTA